MSEIEQRLENIESEIKKLELLIDSKKTLINVIPKDWQRIETFHGGCIGCYRQYTEGLGGCEGCQYKNADWKLPNKFLGGDTRIIFLEK